MVPIYRQYRQLYVDPITYIYKEGGVYFTSLDINLDLKKVKNA